MRIYNAIFIITIFSAIFNLATIGCKDKKIDVSDASENENTSKHIDEKLKDIDVADYKGLEDVFKNNMLIESKGKPIMLIFGANSCKYCEELKNDIKANENLRQSIKQKLEAYYVNTSYSKNHSIAFLHRSMNTDEFARFYNLSNTPLVLFLQPDGEQILKMVGYNARFFPHMIEFSVDENNYKNIKDSKDRMQAFSKKYMKKYMEKA